jgi:hypothetical protein
MSEVEIPQKKKVGRPKTVSVDKKEYQKQYYQKHKETLLENRKDYYSENKDKILEYNKEYQKDYIENLKVNNPEKYQEIRKRQNELSLEYHRKEREAYRIITSLIRDGLLNLPESHKEIILELIN